MVATLRSEPTAADPTIGIIGPEDLVEHVMLMADQDAATSRMVAATYSDEDEAPECVTTLGSSVDVCLFTGPVPYETARRSGVLSMPATYVPLGGAALYSALLRAAREYDYDPRRVSVDVLSRTEIDEAYADLDLDGAHVHVCEGSARADFHQELWSAGLTTAALTCVHTVADQLRDASVPTLEVRPTIASIRSRLSAAAFLGAATQLQTAQIAIAIVDVPTLRETTRQNLYRYWREELRLNVHRLLLDEARRTELLLWPHDDHSYLVAATAGSVSAVTDGFRAPPFVERIRDELGIDVEVGMGLGATAQDAETHARTALSWAQRSHGARGFIVGRSGQAFPVALHEPRRRAAEKEAVGAGEPRGLEVLARVTHALEKLREGSSPLITDAESTARSLRVTERTARRLLRGLVEDGLAWPLPTNRSPQPGRPRQQYRLITEKLHTT